MVKLVPDGLPLLVPRQELPDGVSWDDVLQRHFDDRTVPDIKRLSGILHEVVAGERPELYDQRCSVADQSAAELEGAPPVVPQQSSGACQLLLIHPSCLCSPKHYQFAHVTGDRRPIAPHLKMVELAPCDLRETLGATAAPRPPVTLDQLCPGVRPHQLCRGPLLCYMSLW